jgi:hypothetical protein
LTFRKEGTNIGFGDEITLISANEKSIVYPIEENMLKDLKLTLKNKNASESWLFKDKEVVVNLAQAGELQATYDLIQAGNLPP